MTRARPAGHLWQQRPSPGGRGAVGVGVPGTPSFRTRTVTLQPGRSRPHDEDEWRGALILVDAGEIELCCRAGGRRVFGTGSVLWFTGLGLASVRNPGRVDAVFRGITRGPPG